MVYYGERFNSDMNSNERATEIPGMQGENDMNRPLIRFAATALIAAIGITTAFAGSGGGTRLFVGESIPVVDKMIVTPAPRQQTKNKPQQSTSSAAKPTQGSNPKPGQKPGPKPRPAEAASVVYYTNGFEVNIGQVQQAAQELQPLVEQVLQNMPSAEEIQEMARQLQGPVTQQVEQAVRNMPSTEEIQEMARQLQGPVTRQVEQTVRQLPLPVQEALNEPIIITPQCVNAGNGNSSKSKHRSKSKWTYGVPGMTGGEGNGPLIYNP